MKRTMRKEFVWIRTSEVRKYQSNAANNETVVMKTVPESLSPNSSYSRNRISTPTKDNYLGGLSPPPSKGKQLQTAADSPLAQIMRRRSKLLAQSQHWGWVRGTVMASENIPLSKLIQSEGFVKLLLREPGNEEFHDKVISIPSTLLGDEKCVVRMNTWATYDMNPEPSLTSSEYERSPPQDMMLLVHLHEPALLYALKNRYEADMIYSNTGPILLALNPFKQCDRLYDEEMMQKYKNHNSLLNYDSLPPHVFEVADRAFRSMMKSMHDYRKPTDGNDGEFISKTDQCILVSGESGAGKTVNANHIMRYLSFLSQSRSARSRKCAAQVSKASANIESQLIHSTHILEAFGNARTLRNDNSSRFGKFTEIVFTHEGRLERASIETYLLEKTRLTLTSHGERNYHIFYHILCGLDHTERSQFLLSESNNVQDFKLTSMSGTYSRRDGVRDEDTYKSVVTAMDGMGFSKSEFSDIIGVCCAILHAFNINFLAISDDSSEVDRENKSLPKALALFGIELEDFNKALTTVSISVAGRFGLDCVRLVSREKALHGLEGLLKATYASLFHYIAERIKATMETSKGNIESGLRAYIGVLDIFGFEIFETNSFEQLCINYCNEVLQRQFNDFVLKYEQLDYEEEGIDWSYITFPDNQDVLDLIDKKGVGILDILDDQCITVNTNNKTFWLDMYAKCRTHPRFAASNLQKASRRFEIKHYAGAVEYGTDTFLEKNLDEVPREALELLVSSKNSFVSSLASLLGSSPSKSSRRSTVSGEFVLQLKKLRKKIDSTSPHYIRCLKPNVDFIPNKFDLLLVKNQLRYAGVLEAVRVSRAGFAQRFTIPYFVSRYDVLVEESQKEASTTTRKMCALIVNVIAKKIHRKLRIQRPSDLLSESVSDGTLEVEAGLQIGKTKVYVTQEAFNFMEQMLQERFDFTAIQIQRHARGLLERVRYEKACHAVVLIQRQLRILLAKDELQRQKAAFQIAMWAQKYRRGITARRKYITIQELRNQRVRERRERAAITIQCCYRCYRARNRLRLQRRLSKDLAYVTVERDELRRQLSLLKDNRYGIYAVDELSRILQQIKSQALALENKVNSDLTSPELSTKRQDVGYERLLNLRKEMEIMVWTTELAKVEAEIERENSVLLRQEVEAMKTSVVTPGSQTDHSFTSFDMSRSSKLESYRQRLSLKLDNSVDQRPTLRETDYSIVSSATIIRLVNRIEFILLNGKKVPEVFEFSDTSETATETLSIGGFSKETLDAKEETTDSLVTIDEGVAENIDEFLGDNSSFCSAYGAISTTDDSNPQRVSVSNAFRVTNATDDIPPQCLSVDNAYSVTIAADDNHHQSLSVGNSNSVTSETKYKHPQSLSIGIVHDATSESDDKNPQIFDEEAPEGDQKKSWKCFGLFRCSAKPCSSMCRTNDDSVYYD